MVCVLLVYDGVSHRHAQEKGREGHRTAIQFSRELWGKEPESVSTQNALCCFLLPITPLRYVLSN